MTVPDVPVATVVWGGRDTSALTHEQIYRWVHEGADPGALEDARLRHAAHGEELRTAARRLESAHAELTASWRGRDADAATTHIRTVAARMSGLGDAVSGQAGSLAGVRDAVARVQAAVGPPRPPALPVLGAAPSGLPGGPIAGAQDGFAAFETAQDEEKAAQAAYRAYLDETSAAARAAPSALSGASVTPGVVPAAPVPGGSVRPVPGGRTGVLARAAGAVPSGDGPGSGVLGGPRVPPTTANAMTPTTATASGRSGPLPGLTSPDASPPGVAPSGARLAGAPAGPSVDVTGASPAPTGHGTPSEPAPGIVSGDATHGGHPRMLGRLVARLAGGSSGDPTATRGSGPVPGGTPRAPGPAAGRPTRVRPGRPVDVTAADRLHGAHAPDDPHPAPDATPGSDATPGGTVATTSGPATSGPATTSGPAMSGPLASGPLASGPLASGPVAAMPPMLGPAGALGGPAHAPRHPEYLVEAGPVAGWEEVERRPPGGDGHGPDDRGPRRVAPPVLGEEDESR